jgi:hypothetical protein
MSLASILAKMAKIPTNIATSALLGMVKIKELGGLKVNTAGELSVNIDANSLEINQTTGVLKVKPGSFGTIVDTGGNTVITLIFDEESIVLNSIDTGGGTWGARVNWDNAPNANRPPAIITTFENDSSGVKRVLNLESGLGYVINRVLVAMNGSVLIPGVDYTADSGSTISIISSDGLDDDNVNLSLRDVVVVYHL